MVVNKTPFTLVTGGARSGKSTFAESLAWQEGRGAVTYIATCQPWDDEMDQRVQLHKERRPPEWYTVEQPFQVARAIAEFGIRSKVILVDCLALLVSNYLTGGTIDTAGGQTHSVHLGETKAWAEIEAIAQAAVSAPAHVIIVTNEVGMGLVPSSALGRSYRDLLGKANSHLAQVASSVFLVVTGLPLEIKGLAWPGLEHNNGR